jgi:hypothetical protein
MRPRLQSARSAPRLDAPTNTYPSDFARAAATMLTTPALSALKSRAHSVGGPGAWISSRVTAAVLRDLLRVRGLPPEAGLLELLVVPPPSDGGVV